MLFFIDRANRIRRLADAKMPRASTRRKAREALWSSFPPGKIFVRNWLVTART
jgi:hypothetical protein